METWDTDIVLQEKSTWVALLEHSTQINKQSLSQLFLTDNQRGQNMAIQSGQLYLDYSKNRLTSQTVNLLMNLANECKLKEKIEAMFLGKKVNQSEHRAALHIALRAPLGDHVYLDQENLVPQVQQSLMRMRIISDRIREGKMKGATGRVIKNIIHIGIGGSDLGPVMLYEALKFYSDRGLCLRFVSNVDSSDFYEATRDLHPEECLFIVCSKSFTTTETLSNTRLARAWCLAHIDSEEVVAKHFIAVSANEHAVAEFGIDISTMFVLWDWTGGRYSIDSAVGLSVMIAIGASNFYEFLCGMHEMDQHFLHTPFHENMPVLLGMIAIWNNNFQKTSSLAILPYSHYLRRFPAYLQQLAMESNGKHVDVNGHQLSFSTCPIYWGEPGTNAQHSFYQLLHQGTSVFSADFIGFCQPLPNELTSQDQLVANLIAQTAVLAFGNQSLPLSNGVNGVATTTLEPYQICVGNHSSNTILADTLTPTSIGQLIALYEHSVFTQGAIWNINSFDQWGVESGKKMADSIAPYLQSAGLSSDHQHDIDTSTQQLIQHYLSKRGG